MAKGLALTIGLNAVDPRHYEGWSGKLNACEADARDMADIARSRKFKVQRLLTRRATRRAVLGGIARAASALRSGDIFLLTYSGHGGQVPDRNHDEPDAQDETWCLYNGELIDDEIHQALGRFKPGVRVLVSPTAATAAPSPRRCSMPRGEPRGAWSRPERRAPIGCVTATCPGRSRCARTGLTGRCTTSSRTPSRATRERRSSLPSARPAGRSRGNDRLRCRPLRVLTGAAREEPGRRHALRGGTRGVGRHYAKGDEVTTARGVQSQAQHRSRSSGLARPAVHPGAPLAASA